MQDSTKNAVKTHFDAYAEKWSSRLNSHNYNARFRLVGSLCKDDISSVVDLGCGTGDYSALFEKSVDYAGLDNSTEMIREARNLYKEKIFFVGDVEDTNFATESFDLGLAIGLFEYLELPNKTATELLRLVRNNGVLICSFQNADEKSPLRIPLVSHIARAFARILRQVGLLPHRRDAKFMPNGYHKPHLVAHRKFTFSEIIDLFPSDTVVVEDVRFCNFRLFRYLIGNDLLGPLDKMLSILISFFQVDKTFARYASNSVVKLKKI